MIEYEEPEREMTHHDLTVPSVTSITINHDDCHDYMINEMFGEAAHGWVAAAAWDARLVNQMTTTQTHNYALHKN